MTLYVRLAQSALPIPPQPPPPPEPLPAPSNANCYDHATGDVVEVNSVAKLVAAVNGAPAGGRQVLVAPGSYAGGSQSLARRGDVPVVVQPRDARGSVTINAPRWAMAPDSSRIVMSGLFFTEPEINVNGANHRFTRCQVRRMGRFSFHLFAATDTRIDHCDISDSVLSETTRKAFVRLDGEAVAKGACKRVLIDYNYCHDSTPPLGRNGDDYIGLHSDAGAAVDPGLIIDNCLFERISLPGDGELIGAKASGIVFRYCTVLDMPQPYVNAPRTAERFEVRSSWFERCNPNVVHLMSRDGLLIGNRFVGAVSAWVCPGDYYWAGTPVKGYPAADRCRVIGNRFGSGSIKMGGFWDNAAPSVPARNTNLWGNTRDAGGDAHQNIAGRSTGTTFKRDDEPFEPARKLTAADVGMAAPDPLCPQGPQA